MCRFQDCTCFPFSYVSISVFGICSDPMRSINPKPVSLPLRYLLIFDIVWAAECIEHDFVANFRPKPLDVRFEIHQMRYSVCFLSIPNSLKRISIFLVYKITVFKRISIFSFTNTCNYNRNFIQKKKLKWISRLHTTNNRLLAQHNKNSIQALTNFNVQNGLYLAEPSAHLLQTR